MDAQNRTDANNGVIHWKQSSSRIAPLPERRPRHASSPSCAVCHTALGFSKGRFHVVCVTIWPIFGPCWSLCTASRSFRHSTHARSRSDQMKDYNTNNIAVWSSEISQHRSPLPSRSWMVTLLKTKPVEDMRTKRESANVFQRVLLTETVQPCSSRKGTSNDNFR